MHRNTPLGISIRTPCDADYHRRHGDSLHRIVRVIRPHAGFDTVASGGERLHRGGSDGALRSGGDASELLKADARENLEGLGVPPLRDLIAKAIDRSVPIHV